MLKYEVVKGFLIDLKLREGHIVEHSQLFDTLIEAQEFLKRVSERMTFENEYTSLSTVEFDENGDWDYLTVYTVYNQDLRNGL